MFCEFKGSVDLKDMVHKHRHIHRHSHRDTDRDRHRHVHRHKHRHGHRHRHADQSELVGVDPAHRHTPRSATRCNSLQLTATSVLQYTATPCNTHTQTCVKWCASISSFCSAVQLDRASGRRERRSFCLMLRCFMLHHAPTHRSVCFCVGPPNMSYPVSHNSTHNQRKKWHDTSL